MDRWNARVTAWLDDVIARLRELGVAGLLERRVAEVWERNVDRHDPQVAGDTWTSLGITSSENLRTLLLREDPEVWAERGVSFDAPHNSLVVTAAGVRLHLMKAPWVVTDDGVLVEPDWEATRWSGLSDVRRGAAEDNASRYEPGLAEQRGQTWLPGIDATGSGVPSDDPARLRHVMLVWSGEVDTATTGGWCAVPYAGPGPWLAAQELWTHGPESVPRSPAPPAIALPFARLPSERTLAPRRSPPGPPAPRPAPYLSPPVRPPPGPPPGPPPCPPPA